MTFFILGLSFIDHGYRIVGANVGANTTALAIGHINFNSALCLFFVLGFHLYSVHHSGRTILLANTAQYKLFTVNLGAYYTCQVPVLVLQ